MKKIIISSMASLALLGGTVQTVGASELNNISINQQEAEASEQKKIEKHENKLDLKDKNFGMSEKELNKIRGKADPIKNDLIDQEDNDSVSTYGLTVATVAAVVSIIGGAAAAVKGSYNLGRYGARQVQIKLGVTARQYKANRWYYRAGITAAFGWVVALGFDDYYYGV